MAENKVKRSDFMAFLNTGTKEGPVWSRMGKGITSQVVSYNPATTSETYIDEDSATTNLDSYSVNIATPQTAYKGNAVFDFVDKLRQNRAVGSDAQAEVLLVYAYDKTSENVFKAEKNNAVLQIDDFGGEGGGSVVLNYTVNLNGDPILGTATVENGAVTFNAE